MQIQRLSWAGIKIEVGATTVFVDAIEGAPDWNAGEKPVIPLTAQTDSRHALITHAHTDHFDPVALQSVLGEQGNVICHRSVVAGLAAHQLRVREVEMYEPVLLNWLSAEIMAIAVPASDGWGDPQVSWIIDGGGRRIIHCGDTIWHGHWWNIARAYGPFDLAFMPINGVTYSRGRYTGSSIPATLTPEQAVTASQVLGAQRVCPIHYGMRDPGHYDEFPEALEAFLAVADKLNIPALVLQPGESVNWSGVAASAQSQAVPSGGL